MGIGQLTLVANTNVETGMWAQPPVPDCSPADHPLSGALLGLLLFLPVAASAATVPDAARRIELIKLVRQDCGSCHGMQLTGGLGTPLTPEALRDKPDGNLRDTILNGRPGTPMPPWRAFLSETEAAWIVENLKQGFPDVKP